MDKGFYNELLTGHNLYPDYKYELEDYNLELEGVNPTCGDEITLRLLVEDGVVTDGAFTGDGCAISQALIFYTKTQQKTTDRDRRSARSVDCSLVWFRWKPTAYCMKVPAIISSR